MVESSRPKQSKDSAVGPKTFVDNLFFFFLSLSPLSFPQGSFSPAFSRSFFRSTFTWVIIQSNPSVCITQNFLFYTSINVSKIDIRVSKDAKKYTIIAYHVVRNIIIFIFFFCKLLMLIVLRIVFLSYASCC